VELTALVLHAVRRWRYVHEYIARGQPTGQPHRSLFDWHKVDRH